MPRIFFDDSLGVNTPAGGNDLHPTKWAYKSVSGASVLRIAGANTFRPGTLGQWIRCNLPQIATSDITVTGAKMAATGTGNSRYRLIVRATDDLLGTQQESPTQGYGVLISNAGTIGLYKHAGASAATQLGTDITGFATPGTEFNFRLSISGTTTTNIKVKAWLAGNAEPSTWDIDVNDTTSPYTAAGHTEWVAYRVNGSAQSFSFKTFEVRAPAGVDSQGRATLPINSFAKLYAQPNGEGYKPYGKVRSNFLDDSYNAAFANWMTVTSGTGSVNPTRPDHRITTAATANSVAAVTAPGLTASKVEAIWFGLRSSTIGGTAGQITPKISLVGASSQYSVRCGAADSTITLEVTGNNAQSQSLNLGWSAAIEMPKQRNIGLLLLPNLRQLIAMMDDICLGWLDLPATVTEELVPTVSVTTGNATAATITWRQLHLSIETD